MTVIKLVIAGDLHGSWGDDDHDLLIRLKADAVLFVGDLSEGDLRIVKAIAKLPLPTGVILGNHDRGVDPEGGQLKTQIDLLGEKDCSWRLRHWESPEISLVGARPCSPGGGYFLTKQVSAIFGPVSLAESAERIFEAAQQADKFLPLVLLAHSGPAGLGSTFSSICGRDWKLPSVDWGDKDLSMAIDMIRKKRSLDLVVFGHMHHHLKRGKGYRETFVRDNFGTAYLNAACVPRKGVDEVEGLLFHFSWVEFLDGKLDHVSHRWYRSDASIAYQETLFQA